MKLLHDFDYRRPLSLDEALRILDEHGEEAAPLAGGTDVVVNMKYRSILQLVPGAGTRDARWPAASRVPAISRPRVVVSLNAIEDLKGVSCSGPVASVRPLTTMTEFARMSDVPPALMGLKDAAAIMGSPLIRNRATVGGNLVNARPAADTAIALVAMGAQLTLASTGKTRKVVAGDFFTGPGKSVRKPNEVLTDIEISNSPSEGSAYLRVGNRRQLEIALVGAAAWIRLDPNSGKIADARIALGAVAPTPLLCTAASQGLVGKKPGDKAFLAAALDAKNEARPIDDFRGSAAYRLELIDSLVIRVLNIARDRLSKSGA